MSSSSWMNRCVSLRLQTLFSWHLDLRIHGSSRKHYMGWSCSWSWWKKEKFDAFRKKTFSPLCAWFVLHHVDKNALCYMRVLKFGRTSTSNNLTVFTAVIKLSAFVDDVVKQSAKQFWVEMRARSWIRPEQVSFRNMEIMWIVSFCSGKGIVLAVVTRFLVSVLMWISATSPDMSIHNPRKNWHETKHFMNEYNSATVVESTVLLIFDFRSSQYYHMKLNPSRNAIVILLKILSCLSVKTNLLCFCKKHQESQLFSMVLWVARIEVSLAAPWVVLPACLEPSHLQLLEKLPLKHIRKKLPQHWNCVLLCNTHLSVLDWDLLQFFNKLFLADLNAWSWSKIPHPTNSLSCEEHAIPFFWTNLEMFL